MHFSRVRFFFCKLCFSTSPQICEETADHGEAVASNSASLEKALSPPCEGDFPSKQHS